MNAILDVFNAVAIGYFLVLDASYLVMAVIGWRAVEDYVRRRPSRDYGRVAASPLSPAVTILVPAHNEEATIIESVRALLATRYPALDLVVVNDGSRDGTLAVLEAAFDLHPVARVPRAALTTKPIRGVYASAGEPRLTVVDKENGGKADTLNAGLRYTRTPLFCCIDADTLLDPEALSRIVWEFEADPQTVAAGGIVRVVNGCRVQDGRVTGVATPPETLANIQILEYARAFLGGRVGWSRLGMLLIISGAFGLFRWDVVVEAGGYDCETVGEDAELVVRLHRHQREHGRGCRMVFFPDPICWTEVPTSMKVLVRQRDRWQRGLLELLWKHRAMVGRPRYGVIGLIAMPYFMIFEAFGPLLELLGMVSFLVAVVCGTVSFATALFFTLLVVAFGFVITYAALLMEGRAYRRYPSWGALRRLLLTSVIENVGYRQLMSLVRARAWWTLARGAGGWGEMTRAGFGTGQALKSGVELPTPGVE